MENELIGFVLILLALVAFIYFRSRRWVFRSRLRKEALFAICCFVVMTGLLLMVVDRAVKIPLKGFGTIEASAKKADADASEIAEIRKRVENQRDTIDLAFRNAKQANELVDELTSTTVEIAGRVTQLDETTSESQEALRQISDIINFSGTLFAAQNDNYRAFERLEELASDQNFPFAALAGDAYFKIRLSYNPYDPLVHCIAITDWPPGMDKKNATIEQFTSYLHDKKLSDVFHAYLAAVVNNRGDFSKKSRMDFLIDVLTTSNSLLARHQAGMLFKDQAADENLRWEPFYIEDIVNWWDAHKDKIE